MMPTLYEKIGKGYANNRKPDPKIASQILSRIYCNETILNIGAGTGSYEPKNATVFAVEPSDEMIRQRDNTTTSVIKAQAEELPFPNSCFTNSMAILTLHHWSNREKAFSEVKRVTQKRFIAVTWDPGSEPFWLTREYFPEIFDIDRKIFPDISEFAEAFGKFEISTLTIPEDCTDGFMAAYWCRPEAYLNEKIRLSISSFSKIKNMEQGLAKLRSDISTGEWKSRNKSLLTSRHFDAGYRIITVDL